MRAPIALACLLAGALLTARPAAARDADFPEPEALRPAIEFWMRVYLEVTTSGGLLHDARHLDVVYETLRIDRDRGPSRHQHHVDGRRRHWRAVLERLARGGSPANESEQSVVEMFERALGRPPESHDFRTARDNVRFQLGQRDKFRQGLIASGAYEDEMRAIFRDAGLPEDLAYLPHVESSFNVRAYSKYGAAGVWQFMRGTGRRFMRVDYVVDERLDPIRATHAAARLLAENHRILGNWPLALTAYNHGAAGMARARKRLGTGDIATIVERYQSPSFGFASRNFYAQFLAARRIVRSYESWFGPLERDVPQVIDSVELPFYVQIEDVEKYLGVSGEVVRELNPALRPPVFRAGKRLPRGYRLRLPAGTVQGDALAWLGKIPTDERHSEQHASSYHVVERGDALSTIARRYRTSVEQIVALNNLPGRHRIYPGQVLQLPEGRSGEPAPSRGLVRTAMAAPPPKPKPALPPAPPAEPAAVIPPPAPETAAPETSATAAPEATPATPPPLALTAAAAPSAPTLPAATSPDADSVFRRVDGERIRVDAGETLGHYAEWLEVSASRLRALNGLRAGRSLRVGQQLRLDFSKVDASSFLQRRIEYHKGVEEDFFGSFRVTGTVDHLLRPGENLWILSHRVYAVPTWLIQRYNPDVDLGRLAPGTKLVIPVTEKLG